MQAWMRRIPSRLLTKVTEAAEPETPHDCRVFLAF